MGGRREALCPPQTAADRRILTKKEIKMSEKILLIDGHSILNRAYYGLPELTNAEGLHTNAIYGF